MKDKRFYWINIILPIIFGTIVYVIFREDTYIAKKIFIVAKEFGFCISLSTNSENTIVYIFKNHLCDFLWAYALNFAIFLVSERKKRDVITSLIISIGFGTSIEILQKINVIKGTFDYWDIAYQVVAVLCATTVIFLRIRRIK